MEASTLHAPARFVAPAWRRLGSDEALVAAVRAGDGRAFEVIYDRYHRPLLSFCRHMLGDREEGEDALQQTLLGAYRDLVSSTKPIRLRPWLYTIARNQCLSMLRARRDKVPLDAAEPATDGLASAVAQREDIRNMLIDLRRLPGDQRAALVLAELGSLSHEDIAEVVGCPRAKVKALVFQARRSLAASRLARETPCSDAREQLATLAGGALRRGPLRRHVRECRGCREFQAEVRRQRRTMAALLPVVPTAGLKSAILAEVAIGGGGAAAVGAGALGGIGALGASSAGKLVALGLVALGAGTAGVVAVEDQLSRDEAPLSARAQRASGRAPFGIAGSGAMGAVRRAVPETTAATAGLSDSSGAARGASDRQTLDHPTAHRSVGDDRDASYSGAATNTRRKTGSSGRGGSSQADNGSPGGPEESPGTSRQTSGPHETAPGKPENPPDHSVQAPDPPAPHGGGPVDKPSGSAGAVDGEGGSADGGDSAGGSGKSTSERRAQRRDRD
jgi:RNA polymerase sigma factor (sigma-70 family)